MKLGSTVACPLPPLPWTHAGNLFTGTEELQFYDAQATTWIDNIIPSTACSNFVTTVDIPQSTFTADWSGVPAACAYLL